MDITSKYIPKALATLAVLCILSAVLWPNSLILNAAAECTTKAGVKCPAGTTRKHCAEGQSVNVAKYGDGNCC